MAVVVKAFNSQNIALLATAALTNGLKRDPIGPITACLMYGYEIPAAGRHDLTLVISLNYIIKLALITRLLAVEDTLKVSNAAGIITVDLNDIKAL